jgi:hypothetical protein
MTNGRWFFLFGSVAFLMSTVWFVSQLVEVETSHDDLLA